jgi:hypothetical protein
MITVAPRSLPTTLLRPFAADLEIERAGQLARARTPAPSAGIPWTPPCSLRQFALDLEHVRLAVARAWLGAGIAHGWTADPIPADRFANAWALARGVESFRRNEDHGVIRPTSPESLKAPELMEYRIYDPMNPEQEQLYGEGGSLTPCHWTDDPKSPYKGRPLPELELERRSTGGCDRDKRPVLTRAASKNLRRPDHAKLRTSYRARGELGGKRLDDHVSGVGLWPIERKPDGTPLLKENTHLLVLQDIADAQACLRRRTSVLPVLMIMHALTTHDLTQAQCQEVFTLGRAYDERKALRERVRAMLLDLREPTRRDPKTTRLGVTVLDIANFLRVDRRRVHDLLSA